MALPVPTQTFTGSNGDPLDANWTTMQGSWRIWGNQAASTGSAIHLAYWDTDTFADDHYAQAKIYNSLGRSAGGVGVRLTGNRGYVAVVGGGRDEITVYRIDAGVQTSLFAFTGISPLIGDGDMIRLEVEGSTLRPKVNGVSLGTTSDATYTGGSAGLATLGGNEPGLDDFEADNMAAAPTSTPAYVIIQKA